MEEKRPWILKTVEKQTKNREALLPGIMDCSEYYHHGQKIDLTVPKNRKYGKFCRNGKIIAEENVSVGSPKSLKTAYKKWAKRELSARTEELSAVCRLPFRAFRLTDAKGKWGSCNSEHCIALNWRLIILPTELRDYVIVHELCHTKYLNHSAAFWSEVARFLPNYRTLRSRLKEFGFLTQYLSDV